MKKYWLNFYLQQIEKLQDGTDDKPGLYKVTAKNSEGEEVTGEYNTVCVHVYNSWDFILTKGKRCILVLAPWQEENDAFWPFPVANIDH